MNRMCFVMAVALCACLSPGAPPEESSASALAECDFPNPDPHYCCIASECVSDCRSGYPDALSQCVSTFLGCATACSADDGPCRDLCDDEYEGCSDAAYNLAADCSNWCWDHCA